MIDKKEFWNTIRENAADELVKYSKNNLSIAKSESKVEKLLESDTIDISELENELNYLSYERCAMAYVQGVQDGTKLLHVLLSGEAINHMLKLYGDKTDGENQIDWIKVTGGAGL